MKRLIALVLIIICSAVGWKIMQRQADPVQRGGRGGNGRAVAVETATPQRGILKDVRQFTGTLRPIVQFDVAPKVSGRLIELHVDLGDPVRSLQEVAQLDDEEFRVTLLEREAELEVARAQLRAREAKVAQQKAEFDRTDHLLGKKMASASEFDLASVNLQTSMAEKDVAEAQVRQKEAAVEAIRVKQGFCRLHAPDNIDVGSFYVGERFVDPGALLKVNEPILRLVCIDQLRAQIYVIERDYERLAVNMDAVLTTDAIPGRSFPCRIARISPVVDEASRQAPVELEVPNPEYRLKPGMFIRVELTLNVHEDALIVPLAALCNREGRDGVFVVDTAEGRADFLPVKTGIRTPRQVEILEPEQITGEVVVLGHHLLGSRGGQVLSGHEHAAGGSETSAGDSPRDREKPAPGRGGKPGDGGSRKGKRP